MKQEKIGKSKLWKWAFFLLLALNLAFVAFIASRLLEKSDRQMPQTNQTSQQDVTLGLFQTNRQQLNQALASYLEDYQSKQLSYQVYATANAIVFEGTYQLLGYDLPLYLYFQPYRLASGALELKVTSVSVGTLALPIKEVLKYIQSSYKLPQVVTILPKEEAIRIMLQDLKNEAGIYVKASKVDLLEDEIIFEVFKKK
ncbi:YpmS family protein [Streptococcus cuniculipharyngis]|uniref:DUF2140 family protein n=1 Tax=Streptococcus cuniculipharyngis TaxID=1562651 RepID=A0A5C5SDZ0_9STRE|nr:YpmS family protein [Streptococcus cuniculipharyngis]TWS98979.1 DUF2140 family protein [Streptococcus cuniculipharyngis]